MAFATIMVHVDLDGVSDGRTRLALGLANRFEATLIGGAAQAVPPIMADGIAIEPQLTDEEYEQLRSRLAKQEISFREMTSHSRKPADWRPGIDLPTQFVAREARAADLVIVGRDPLSRNIYQSMDPADLILSAGRPVLTVPKSMESLKAKSIIVAWKDTREARRAMQDALPFLHEAEKVFIAEVCQEDTEQDARQRVGDVAHYLTRHRIKAPVEILPQAERAVADELIRLAQNEDADLIVAGAYGHSRLGEWIFGGVTRGLLKASPKCCLFSH